MPTLSSNTGCTRQITAGQTDTITFTGPSGGGWDSSELTQLRIENLDTTAVLEFSIDGQHWRPISPSASVTEQRPNGASFVVALRDRDGAATPAYTAEVVDPESETDAPYQWLLGAVNQVIPDGEWTPLAFPDRRSGDLFVVDRGLDALECTVAAASNGQSLGALTGDTLNVDGLDDASWPTPTATHPEYLMITTAGGMQVVEYTGRTAAAFTGVTTGSLAVATGDTIKVAPINIFADPPSQGDFYLVQQVVALVMESSALGSVRRLRYNARVPFGPLLVDFIVFGNDYPPINAPAPGQRMQLTGQPGVITADPGVHVIEVFQDTGGDLDVVKQDFESPIIMQAFFDARESVT